MKTIEELEKIADEIKEFCLQRGVVIIGTCDYEGTLGEITLTEPNSPYAKDAFNFDCLLAK